MDMVSFFWYMIYVEPTILLITCNFLDELILDSIKYYNYFHGNFRCQAWEKKIMAAFPNNIRMMMMMLFVSIIMRNYCTYVHTCTIHTGYPVVCVPSEKRMN